MSEIILFKIGFLACLVGVSIFLFVYFLIMDKIDSGRAARREKDNIEFVKNVRERYIPNYHSEDCIYDGSGELIWDRVRGCVGPATYIKV